VVGSVLSVNSIGKHNFVASAKTQETAWALIERLRAACPVNGFVVVLENAGAKPAIHATGAFHPIDRAAAQCVVKAFVAAMSEKSHSNNRGSRQVSVLPIEE